MCLKTFIKVQKMNCFVSWVILNENFRTNEGEWEAVLYKNCCYLISQEDTPDNERTLAMRENTYVRLYGHMRAFGGKTSVVAFRVVPIVDMNELTMHLLEVMHSQMVLTQSVSDAQSDGADTERK